MGGDQDVDRGHNAKNITKFNSTLCRGKGKCGDRYGRNKVNLRVYGIYEGRHFKTMRYTKEYNLSI